MGAVEPLTFLVLDPDRAVAVVQNRPASPARELDAQPVRMVALARPAAVRGTRRAGGYLSSVACSAHRLRRVSTTRQSFGSRSASSRASDGSAELPQAVADRLAMSRRTWSSAIASSGAAFSVGSHPDQPWRLRSTPRSAQKRADRPVPAVLDAPEVLPHRVGAPRANRR